ncbi:MAG: Omp28-related outer membrane protein, partial [Bacteroidetes bacterium]|nr:Omp28-related outer membrane protein [Bacteroidota bacterium]
MKIKQYYTIIIALILSIVVLNAQTPKWVSTKVEKRTAVIEYFTGIYHQAAPNQDFKENYYLPKHPDQFIFIHNHCTDSAAPKAGTNHPDLRTDEGKIIFEELKLKTDSLPFEELPFAEPPYDLLNRIPNTKGWHYSWNANYLGVMSATSIVNVYVKPSIDFTTRELTVEVEYYYTGDSPAEINYLTVMLLQNNIICHQTGGLLYRDYVVDDTLYRQMHVLRKVISTGGAWGDSITVTKKGSYELRKYTVKLPESINNVPLVLTDLEVAAFIAED